MRPRALAFDAAIAAVNGPAAVATASGAIATPAPNGTPGPAAPPTAAVPTAPDPYYDAPRKRGSGVFIGILVLLLIALGVALFFIGSNIQKSTTTAKVTVPTRPAPS